MNAVVYAEEDEDSGRKRKAGKEKTHLFGDVGECLERDEDLFVVRGVDEGLEVRRAREDEAVQAVRSVQHDLRACMIGE